MFLVPIEIPELPPIPESERTPLVEVLVGIIGALRAEVKELRLENGQLKERIARLEKNSSNSSKPPSSDITKPESEQRQPGKRKIGGQKGHQGSFRKAFSSEEIDQRRKLKITKCPDCSAALEATGKVQIHQQAELREKPVIVTEYQLQGGHCPCCNKTVYPELPSGVIPNQLMGPRLLSLIGYMKAAMGVSISELQEFSCEVLKLRLSRSSVQSAIFRVSDALLLPYEELGKAIPEQPALNIDETGWTENGKRQWVWLFCNKLIALFVISKSRGCQVLKNVLGEDFLGNLTSDFYCAYVSYASPKQQFCLAHLIRDIKFLTTLPDEVSKNFGIRLLVYMKRLFTLWHARKSLTPEQWNRRANRFKISLERFLFSQKFDKKTDAHRIQRRLIKHWASIFRFLDNPVLYEPTNNHAERTLRPVVRLRRISQGSRGQAGSDWTQRAASILATCRLQKKSVWNFFRDALNAKYFHTLTPTLIQGT
jgi:transposase